MRWQMRGAVSQCTEQEFGLSGPMGSVVSGECGQWGVWSVGSVVYGECGLSGSMGSVVYGECGLSGSMGSVVSGECGQWGVWSVAHPLW